MKKILSMIFLVLATVTFSFPNLADGLIAYYPFNGNANDESGKAQNGIVQGAILSTDRFNHANSAYSFDGITASIDTNIPLINTAAGAQNTVTFWMDWSGIDPQMGAALAISFPGNDPYALEIYQGGIGFHTGNSDIYGTSSQGLANKWVHVAAIFTNGNITLNKLYLDGASRALNQILSSPRQGSVTANMRISGWTKAVYYPYSGKIDDVRVYNRALSDAEVKALYTGGSMLAVGLGRYDSNGGWMSTYAGSSENFALKAWIPLPWDAYNRTGGETHPALGDIDGDGLNELVVGLGSGGGGWIAILDDADHGYAILQWLRLDWQAYNTGIGAVYPAIGDVDGDGRLEIVAGLGKGGMGRFEIFDDSTTNYKPIGWRQVGWEEYNQQDGSSHPVIADLDGDRNAEIVLGLGTGSDGWLEVIKSFQGNYEHRDWIRAQAPGAGQGSGETFPAAGDIDHDGKDELVVGLGQGGAGWINIMDDADHNYASLKWLQLSWTDYNNKAGETHPAVGDIDGDSELEIVLGLGPFPSNGGWMCILDDSKSAYKILNWKQIQWSSYNSANGETYPALAR